MLSYEVKDMTCGHCVSSITKAVQSVDANAQVRVDLGAHRVQVEGHSVNGQSIAQAISSVGFTPEPVADATALSGARPKQGGCCG